MDEGDELEALLKRYQVVAPPPALRPRILADAAAPRSSRLRDWLFPLGAAAVISLLYVRAAQLRNVSVASDSDAARAGAVDRLPEPLQSDPAERAMAEHFIRLEESAARAQFLLEPVPHD